jgi:hypothetical protein
MIVKSPVLRLNASRTMAMNAVNWYGSSGRSVPGVRLKLLMKTTTSGGGVAGGLKMEDKALAMKVSVEDASRLYPQSTLYQLMLAAQVSG